MNPHKLLVIAKVLPEPASSAAGKRMLQIIALFTEWGWSVEMASVAKASEFSENMETLGIPLHHIQLNNSSFDTFISTLNPQAVLFDRFMTEEQFGWRVAENCPNALRILDTEDLHGLRAARETALNENRLFQTPDLLNVIAFREISSILRCDLSLIISEFEMQLLNDFFHVPSTQLFYLPFLVDSNEIHSTEKSQTFVNRRHFLSIGNFLHAPNLDAVKYLHQSIWPEIKKRLPDAELHIYGAYLPSSITQLSSKTNGFIVKGRTENLKEVMSGTRLLLAPLRFGAGLKGKLLDAMLNGTPSITSNIGAEGMKNKCDWPGRIADSQEDFVNSAVELYDKEHKWKQAAENCGETMQMFMKENFSEPFRLKIHQLIQKLKEHRLFNFTGAMLQQQQFNSSKFMGLWIEEKNKRS